MNDDINTKRTELANQMAAAGAAALDFNATAAVLAAIPDTEPQQYVAAGTPENIAAILPATISPARRMRHGDRPTEALVFDEPAATSGDAPTDAKDAARYRWIRQFGFQAFDVIFDADGDLLAGDALDNALDSIPSLARIESAAAPAATSGDAPDLQQLKALALAYQNENGEHWYNYLQLADGISYESAADFMVKVSPAVVLDLIARIERLTTIPEQAPSTEQEWAKVDPAVAFHLIERHAENWTDAGRMMLAWRDANPAPATASGDELPELPVAAFPGGARSAVLAEDGYTADQMCFYARAAVSAATKPTADLPDENECWVHIYPSDLKRMERTETHATVFSVAVGRTGEVSVPLYTAEQVQSLLATKPAAPAVPEGLRLAGVKMANTMFNLAQRCGEVIDSDLCSKMDAMRKEWDGALLVCLAAPSATPAAQDQAKADPVEHPDKVAATITVKLRADSGYSADQQERISATQWGRICAILAGKYIATPAASEDAASTAEQVRAIYDAVHSNAAPYKVEYALGQVDEVNIKSGLLCNLFDAAGLFQTTEGAGNV